MSPTSVAFIEPAGNTSNVFENYMRLPLLGTLYLGTILHECGYEVSIDYGATPEKDKILIAYVGDPNWVEMVDALIDILYVTFGAFTAMGISSRSRRTSTASPR